MNPLGYYARQFMTLPCQYPHALWLARRHRAVLDQPERFALFIGYLLSGHSLIGALLNAHAEMVFSRELDALQFVYARFSRRQILALILDCQWQSDRRGLEPWRFKYAVAGQWQGRFRALRVIGDKQGEATSLRLQANPELLDRLRETVGLPIRFIHVVRNPYDTIATIARRTARSLTASAEYYFSVCATVTATRQRVAAEDWLDLRHEDFVANPRAELRELCRFLGVESPEDYLADCARIVFDSPHRSRHETEWPSGLVESIRVRAHEYSYLHGYDLE